MSLASKIAFTSYLKYSPREGHSQACKNGRVFVQTIKNDSNLTLTEGAGIITVRGIDWVIGKLKDAMIRHPILLTALGPDRILIPIPRSAPLKNQDSLWPTMRICEELVKNGLGATIVCALERHTAVQRSSTAEKGQRPMAADHINSTRIAPNSPMLTHNKITLVDDVLTRGATLAGMHYLVANAFPHHDISSFALIRTMSFDEIDTVVDPVSGTITLHPSGKTYREP